MKRITLERITLVLMAVCLIAGCLDEVEFPKYNDSKNYCGPEGVFSVPRTNPLTGADFNTACYNHDKCYADCKTNGKTQGDCDLAYRQTMDDACDTEFDRMMSECDKKAGYNPLKYSCIASARLRVVSCWGQVKTYYEAVSAGGKAIGSYPCQE